MNILVVSQYYYPEPFRINEICEELVKRGHLVTVITTNPNYPDGDIYEGYDNTENKKIINGVNVIRCKTRPRYRGSLNLVRNYISFVRSSCSILYKIKDKFDCVYVYQLSPVTSCIPAIKYKRKHKIPLFLYCLDVWPESLRGSALDKEIIFKVIKRLSAYIYKNADKIAVTSPSFVSYLGTLCKMDQNKIMVIPQHSDDILKNGELETFIEFVKYEEYINFMFMGNIGDAQNLECTMRAISLIKNRTKLKLHIVGSGSNLDKIKDMVQHLGIEDTVIFYGRHLKSDMPKFYSFVDVCIVSLKDQGIIGYTIPGKLQEYMSAGKAILACINGDAAKVINEAKCGVCVPADNAERLAEAIQKMALERENLKIFGERARNYYKKNFTIKNHVNELEKMIKSVKEGN